MNQYLFTTPEGYTQAPNVDVEVENCQLLARIDADDFSRAKSSLIIDNPWILECEFDPNNCSVDQVITRSQRDAVKSVVDYFWEKEKQSFEESNHPKNHIYLVLKRLRDMVVDSEPHL